MLDINSNITTSKKITFFLVILISSLVTFLLLFSGYFAYKKLSLSYDYCNSFGKIDSEIGWVLEKNVNSCLSLSNKISGEVFFDTKIYTDANGFRTDKIDNNVLSSFLAIGDSWTFGYGVNGDETYPYYLSKLLKEPVHNSGVPAYGSASTYLYAKLNIEKIKPKTVIYFTKGLYRRSLCPKPWVNYVKNPQNLESDMHEKLLIPCYLVVNGNVNLLKPLTGVVEESVKNNVYPGGSLTSGYNSLWQYLLFTKPKAIFQEFKERFLYPLPDETTKLEDYLIKKYELNSFLKLAFKNDFQFVLIDPHDDYKKIIITKDIDNIKNLIYIDSIDWQEYFIKASIGMPADDLFVPMDGHFGKGANKLIANLIYQKMIGRDTILAN